MNALHHWHWRAIDQKKKLVSFLFDFCLLDGSFFFYFALLSLSFATLAAASRVRIALTHKLR